MVGKSAFLGGMSPTALPQSQNTQQVSADGRLSPEDRVRLRKIPSFKNAWSVAWLYGQNILLLAVTVRINNP
ncbi:MAG: hypothetical protein ACK48T_12225, partial [Acidimicrobiaceae bacterium]